MDIEMEEIYRYLKQAKNGKTIGIDGCCMEFWKELCKKENMSKILVKLMNGIYEMGFFFRLEDKYAKNDTEV
jgi:hypothetical protein